MSILSILIWTIIIAGAVGIVLVVLRVAGVTIPEWLIKILLILAVCAVGIIGIKFLAGLAGVW